MKRPDSLIAMALTGASRYQALPPAPHPVLAEAWTQLDESNLPQSVLQAAALEGIAARAGFQAPTDVRILASAPADDLPHVPETAVVAARRMLKGEYTQGWSEWLRLCQRQGCLAPPRLLPALFDLGTQQRNLRPQIRKVAGKHGAWLARQLNTWSWVLEEADVLDEAWEVGDQAERIAWLRQERAKDPQRAIAAIQETWASEPGEMRDAITLLAAEAPIHADQIWLESLALSDRRQNVRQSAISALLRLPDSAFAQRAQARLAKIIRLEKKRLTLDAPDAFDDDWRSDAIQEKAPRNQGQKAWWAKQILTQNPVGTWAKVLGISVSQLVEMKLDPDWAQLIEEALLEIAQQMPNTEFLQHFLPSRLRSEKARNSTPRIANALSGILGAMPPDAIPDMLETIHLDEALTLDLLARFMPEVQMRHQRLTRLLGEWFKQKQTYMIRPTAEALAFCVAPESIESLLRKIAALPELPSAAEAFACTLEFRQSYIPHINPTHPPKP